MLKVIIIEMQTFLKDIEGIFNGSFSAAGCTSREKRTKTDASSTTRRLSASRRGLSLPNLDVDRWSGISSTSSSDSAASTPRRESRRDSASLWDSSLFLPSSSKGSAPDNNPQLKGNPFSSTFSKSFTVAGDRESILARLLSDRRIYAQASLEVRGDEEFAARVIAIYPEVFSQAPLHIRNNVDIASVAVLAIPLNIRWVGPKAKEDPVFWQLVQGRGELFSGL